MDTPWDTDLLLTLRYSGRKSLYQGIGEAAAMHRKVLNPIFSILQPQKEKITVRALPVVLLQITLMAAPAISVAQSSTAPLHKDARAPGANIRKSVHHPLNTSH